MSGLDCFESRDIFLVSLFCLESGAGSPEVPSLQGFLLDKCPVKIILDGLPFCPTRVTYPVYGNIGVLLPVGFGMETTTSKSRAPQESAESSFRATDRPYPGALVVVEGIDGSGKSTQLYLLKRWLEISNYRIHFTEWNSSPLVKRATRRGKKRRMLTPTTFSLIHAADFADRCERQIMPLLQGGYLVLADRYIYTAFARDAARSCSPEWLRNLYGFAPVPDITFYFRAPLEISLNRILSGRPELKYYEAGMDMGLSVDQIESFRLFQGMIQDQYDQMVNTDNFVLMDGTLPVNELQQQMRQIVQERIELQWYARDTAET